MAAPTTSKTTGGEIKTMKLYTHLDRIDKELEASGLLALSSTANTTTCPLTASQLSPFDSMHYLGDEAVQEAMRSTNIYTSQSTNGTVTVLDIGSGLGGPARLLSEWSGCRVDALELQSDLNERARQLTRKCGKDLSDKVHHFCGNFVASDCGGIPLEREYQAIVSFLVFLHISQRQTLFQNCWKHLKPGGRMYVEDYVRLGDSAMTDRELELLSNEVYVQHELPTWDELKRDLQAQGFHIVSCHEKTQPWCDYVRDREQQYAANLERHEQVYGKESAAALYTFYKAVNELFQGGRLGGVAYTVEKPAL